MNEDPIKKLMAKTIDGPVDRGNKGGGKDLALADLALPHRVQRIESRINLLTSVLEDGNKSNQVFVEAIQQLQTSVSSIHERLFQLEQWAWSQGFNSPID